MHVVFAILAVWRLTELATVDTISAPIRKRWPWYIWTCPRCVSVWAGIVATVAYVYFPWFNWPFGLSGLYLIYHAILSRLQPANPIKGQGLILDTDSAGNVIIVRSDFNAAGLAKIAAALADFSGVAHDHVLRPAERNGNQLRGSAESRHPV